MSATKEINEYIAELDAALNRVAVSTREFYRLRGSKNELVFLRKRAEAFGYRLVPIDDGQ